MFLYPISCFGSSLDYHTQDKVLTLKSSTARLLAITLALLSVTGCQQRIANELIGKWEGRPDTATEREKREAEKYEDQQEETAKSDSEGDLPTDWEAYDVAVAIEFVNRTDIKVSLGSEAEPVVGTWSMLQSGPSGCTIEVKTPTGEEGAEELRRYRLELDQRKDQLHGFMLTEVGADRGLGALYFKRPESSKK